jgi:hypothetical protein
MAGSSAAVGIVTLALAVASQIAAGISIGSSSLSGRVTDQVTRRPLRDVVVTLTSDDLKHKLSTITDASGTFEFARIAAGAYIVDAELPGYVPQTFGMDDRRRDAALIRVEVGEHRRAIDVALVRGGSITGRVTSDNGQPVRNAQVGVLEATGGTGARRFMQSIRARTNERGEFTLTDLPEGSYYVSAMAMAPDHTAAGLAPGFRQVFFPGSTSINGATAVEVRATATTGGINLTLPRNLLIRLSGTVLRGISTGPITATLLRDGSFVQTVRVDRNGAFSTQLREPNRYTLVATSESDGFTEAATMAVDVVTDLEGIFLPLAPTGVIAGRVVTDTGTPIPRDVVQVGAVLADDGTPIDPLSRNRADVSPDGSFELRGVFGRRIMRVFGSGAWQVTRVLVGKDPVDAIAVPSAGEVSSVVVVIGQR